MSTLVELNVTTLSESTENKNILDAIIELVDNGIHFQYKHRTVFDEPQSYIYVSLIEGIEICQAHDLVIHCLTVVDSQPMAVLV